MKKILIFLFPFLYLSFSFANKTATCVEDMYQACEVKKEELKVKNRLTSPTVGVKLDPAKMSNTVDKQVNQLKESEIKKERKALKKQKEDLEKQAGRIADVVEDEVGKRVEKIEDKLEDEHEKTEDKLEQAYDQKVEDLEEDFKRRNANLKKLQRGLKKEKKELEQKEEDFRIWRKNQLDELANAKKEFDRYIEKKEKNLTSLSDRINTNLEGSKTQEAQREIIFATKISLIIEDILKYSPRALKDSGKNMPEYLYKLSESFAKLTNTIDSWIDENPALVSLEFLALIYFTYQTGKGFMVYTSYVLNPGRQHVLTKKPVTSDALPVRKLRTSGFFTRLKNALHPGRFFGFAFPFLASAAIGSHVVDHITLDDEKRDSLRKANNQVRQEAYRQFDPDQLSPSSSSTQRQNKITPITASDSDKANSSKPDEKSSEEDSTAITDILND